MDLKLEKVELEPAVGDIVKTKNCAYLIAYVPSNEEKYVLINLQSGHTVDYAHSILQLLNKTNTQYEVIKNDQVILGRKQEIWM